MSNKKKMKFRNISAKGKTFDGYEKDVLGFLNMDNVKKFAEETGQSITDAFKELKKRFGINDMRKGGMVINTMDNRKKK